MYIAQKTERNELFQVIKNQYFRLVFFLLFVKAGNEKKILIIIISSFLFASIIFIIQKIEIYNNVP